MRAEKGGFLAMAMDPAAACEITMQPIRRFGMDAAIIFSDILVIPMALGMHLEFAAGEGPKLDALSSAKDLARLDRTDFDRLNPVYDALSRTRSALKEEGFDHTALIGFAGAPWTVATYMIEGGSSRDFMKTKNWAFSDPKGFAALMDILVEATADYLIRQVEAGAEALQIFDSWAGALDGQSFDRWCIQPIAQIVARVRNIYPDVPIIGFPKGAGNHYVDFAQRSGVSALGLDQQTPAAWAAQNLQTLKPVQGNLDPLCLMAGGEALERAARHILDTFSAGPFIFNLGHGINKDTPVEHVETLVAMIKNYERS